MPYADKGASKDAARAAQKKYREKHRARRNAEPSGEQADHWESLAGVRVPNYTKGAIKHPRGLLCQSCNVGLGRYEEHQRPAGLVLEPYERYLTDPPVNRLVS